MKYNPDLIRRFLGFVNIENIHKIAPSKWKMLEEGMEKKTKNKKK
jgi:hypothetical protein